jgi:hypothetical protein
MLCLRVGVVSLLLRVGVERLCMEVVSESW